MRSSVALSSRRQFLVLGAAALASPAWAATPPDGRLAFTVLRNGRSIGEHAMTFRSSGGVLRIQTHMAAAVRLGPVPLFRYLHLADETWRDGAFEQLRTSTTTNGKHEEVQATRTAGGVEILGTGRRFRAPAEAAPLSHWNPAVFHGPLFNPQTGKPLRVSARRGGASPADSTGADGEHWIVRGEAEIDDWYDATGVWIALRGRLPDGSIMEYRPA